VEMPRRAPEVFRSEADTGAQAKSSSAE
jgi:hypothetical protein